MFRFSALHRNIFRQYFNCLNELKICSENYIILKKLAQYEHSQYNAEICSKLLSTFVPLIKIKWSLFFILLNLNVCREYGLTVNDSDDAPGKQDGEDEDEVLGVDVRQKDEEREVHYKRRQHHERVKHLPSDVSRVYTLLTVLNSIFRSYLNLMLKISLIHYSL